MRSVRQILPQPVGLYLTNQSPLSVSARSRYRPSESGVLHDKNRSTSYTDNVFNAVSAARSAAVDNWSMISSAWSAKHCALVIVAWWPLNFMRLVIAFVWFMFNKCTASCPHFTCIRRCCRSFVSGPHLQYSNNLLVLRRCPQASVTVFIWRKLVVEWRRVIPNTASTWSTCRLLRGPETSDM